jgi:citrate lyase beta subunit
MVITYLFVPAHDPRKVRNALASPADAVILDLEDAVPEQMKASARDAAARVLGESADASSRVWVRINGAHTPHHELDLRAIPWDCASGLVFPKAEDVGSIQRLDPFAPRGLLLILESALGLARVADLVAAAPVVPRLALGTWDLALDLGLSDIDDPDDSELVWHARCQLVLNSRALGLHPPVDGVFHRIAESAAFESTTARVRRLGFGGKLLVHPIQISLAKRIFAGNPMQVAEAQELVRAYERAAEAGTGAINFHGQMIDRVHVERARAVLARSSRSESNLLQVKNDSRRRR